MSRTTVGLAANRPDRAARGRVYIAEDTDQAWASDGTNWIEISNDAVAPSAAGSEVVALMLYFEQVDWATDDEDPAVIPGTLEVAGDGERWARVTGYIPELYASFTTDGEAEEFVRLRVLLGNEDLTVTYQEAELTLASVTDGARDVRSPMTVVALVPPWEGDLELAMHIIGSSTGDVINGGAVGWTEPDPAYDKPISVVVEMFDAPALIVTGPEA